MATEKAAAAVKPTRTRSAGSSSGAGDRLRKYYGEVIAELKKSHWPTKQELKAQTQVVLGLLVIIGVFLFASDVLFSLVFSVLLRVVGGQNH